MPTSSFNNIFYFKTSYFGLKKIYIILPQSFNKTNFLLSRVTVTRTPLAADDHWCVKKKKGI